MTSSLDLAIETNACLSRMPWLSVMLAIHVAQWAMDITILHDIVCSLCGNNYFHWLNVRMPSVNSLIELGGAPEQVEMI